jgi:hypothetical protein
MSEDCYFNSDYLRTGHRGKYLGIRQEERQDNRGNCVMRSVIKETIRKTKT